jgi:hypothetical protein
VFTTPKDISAAARSKYGAEVTPGYASIIKGSLKKRKGGKKAVVKGRRVVRAAAKSEPSDLSLENLALRFALKAGSVEAAIAALEKLR